MNRVQMTREKERDWNEQNGVNYECVNYGTVWVVISHVVTRWDVHAVHRLHSSCMCHQNNSPYSLCLYDHMSVIDLLTLLFVRPKPNGVKAKHNIYIFIFQYFSLLFTITSTTWPNDDSNDDDDSSTQLKNIKCSARDFLFRFFFSLRRTKFFFIFFRRRPSTRMKCAPQHLILPEVCVWARDARSYSCCANAFHYIHIYFCIWYLLKPFFCSFHMRANDTIHHQMKQWRRDEKSCVFTHRLRHSCETVICFHIHHFISISQTRKRRMCYESSHTHTSHYDRRSWRWETIYIHFYGIVPLSRYQATMSRCCCCCLEFYGFSK